MKKVLTAMAIASLTVAMATPAHADQGTWLIDADDPVVATLPCFPCDDHVTALDGTIDVALSTALDGAYDVGLGDAIHYSELSCAEGTADGDVTLTKGMVTATVAITYARAGEAAAVLGTGQDGPIVNHVFVGALQFTPLEAGFTARCDDPPGDGNVPPLDVQLDLGGVFAG